MKTRKTYRPSFFSTQKKLLIVCGFLLLLIAKPIANIPLTFEDIKFELLDITEKENSSKKETVSENEKEIIIVCFINDYSFYNFNNHLNTKRSLSYQLIDLSFLNFNIDIQKPPPRV